MKCVYISQLNNRIMSIRVATNCGTCMSFTATNICKTHEVKVSNQYICDQFTGDSMLNKAIDCVSCSRHEREDCKHPDIATKGMLCTSWAPKI